LLSFAGAADHDRFSFTAAYLLSEKDHLVGSLEALGVRTVCLGSSDGPLFHWTAALHRVARRADVDVVHFHSPLVAGLGRPVAAALRKRPGIVTTEHNVWSSFHPLTRLVDRATAPLDDQRFSVSDAVRRALPSRLQIRSEVLIHGVDVDGISARRRDREAMRRQLAVDDMCVVVTIANLRADKDYPNLFSAAEQVLRRRDDVVFVSIGQGQMEEQLRCDLARRGLGERFRMLGHREDPVGYLVAADVFTLASRHEGLPISLLEALAAGLPAAVTAVGGVPDVVRDGVEGRLVPPGDPTALAEAIEALLDPATNAVTSEAALRRSRDFDIRPAVERQQEVYEQLAARRR
jgi:glycosyltransferase involved in cell wall biosynthesis